MTVKNSTQLITPTFKMARERCSSQTGPIFHSDRGAQYTSHGFQRFLHEHGITHFFPLLALSRKNHLGCNRNRQFELR